MEEKCCEKCANSEKICGLLFCKENEAYVNQYFCCNWHVRKVNSDHGQKKKKSSDITSYTMKRMLGLM